MNQEARYILWRSDSRDYTHAPLSQILNEFPTVKVLKMRDPDYAVVLMNGATEERIRERFPDLLMEKDIQHRLIAAS